MFWSYTLSLHDALPILEAQLLMDTIEREILANRVRTWILEAGRMIRDKINNPRTISTKSNPNDLVTEMDKEVEFFLDRKSTRLNSRHVANSYAVFCLKK